jgi:hypothetical protein
VRDLVFEDRILYTTSVCGDDAMWEDLGDDGWMWAGHHDVPAWVSGVLDVSGIAVRRSPDPLTVATEQ